MHSRFLFSGMLLVCLSAWLFWFQVSLPGIVYILLWFGGLFLWLFGYAKLLLGVPPSANAHTHSALVFSALLIALFTPPELSKDVYIYLLQGKLAWEGILTYTDGSLNLAHHWVEYVDPQWRDCPNHYGLVPMAIFVVAGLAPSVFIGLVVLKLFFAALAWLCYKAVLTIARLFDLDNQQTQRAVLAFCLNPIFLLQGLGQMHIDLLSSLLVFGFIYGLFKKRNWWLAPICIGALGATKFLLFPVFAGLYFVCHLWLWRQGESPWGKAILGFFVSSLTLIILYLPIWQGAKTITHPLSYHEAKEPVKSVTELVSYVIAFAQPAAQPINDAADPLLAQKIAAGKIIAPVFKLLAIFLALWVVWRMMSLQAHKKVLFLLGVLVLLVFILYSPVMHPWYFLFVLPFFTWYAHEKQVFLYLVVTFGLSNTYELGPMLEKPWSQIITIGFTAIAVLSYFLNLNAFLRFGSVKMDK